MFPYPNLRQRYYPYFTALPGGHDSILSDTSNGNQKAVDQSPSNGVERSVVAGFHPLTDGNDWARNSTQNPQITSTPFHNQYNNSFNIYEQHGRFPGYGGLSEAYPGHQEGHNWYRNWIGPTTSSAQTLSETETEPRQYPFISSITPGWRQYPSGWETSIHSPTTAWKEACYQQAPQSTRYDDRSPSCFSSLPFSQPQFAQPVEYPAQQSLTNATYGHLKFLDQQHQEQRLNNYQSGINWRPKSPASTQEDTEQGQIPSIAYKEIDSNSQTLRPKTATSTRKDFVKSVLTDASQRGPHQGPASSARSKTDPRSSTNPPSPARKWTPSIAAVLKPKPTPWYLDQASHDPVRKTSPGPLLVILDLNGTLLFRSGNKRSSCYVPRPRVQDFLVYLFSRHKVMVWSSARPENVQKICESLFTEDQQHQLLAIWARDTLRLTRAQYNEKVQVYKQLSWVWAGVDQLPPGTAGAWNQSNTVLIDDSRLKAAAEPYNLIEIDEFENRPHQQIPDVLGQAVQYMEEASWHCDVSAYIRSRPFIFDSTRSFDWETVQQRTAEKE